MFCHLRRTVRQLCRLARPAVALALVLAQCVATFGYPVVVRDGETIRRCGCKVRGPSQVCCCGPSACCGSVPSPEPEEPACPLCKVKSAAKAAAPANVTWVAGVKARQCHGESPQGLIAEFPSIPPETPSRALAAPARLGVVTVRDDALISRPSIPPDPPPRRG